MKHQIQELSDLKRQAKIQELIDELLMPSGVLAVIVLAAILIVVFFWKTSGLTKSACTCQSAGRQPQRSDPVAFGC